MKADDIRSLATWDVKGTVEKEIAFRTARVLLQDFTGVPAVVDLAAMRDALARLGGDPKQINPLQPVDLVIDHSVQVDEYGTEAALLINADFEFQRNQERYAFLRWGQKALHNFRVVPPDTGIVHQINLEYLAKGVFTEVVGKQTYAYPDSLVGTDSHTTMINGLGVLGWGVGGIEAEAAMLGQPVSMLIPEVVGFKLHGKLPPGATATDLVLTVTEMLRKKKVVGKFVEFYGAGLSTLSLADRATIANMAPEYGATMGFFPVDAETINYLRFTGRDEAQMQLVEAYAKAQGIFRTDDTPDPAFSDTLDLDLRTIEPSLAGPKRPQDRVPLKLSKKMFKEALAADLERTGTVSAIAAAKQAMSVAASPQLSPSVVATDSDEQAGENSSVPVEMNGEKFSIRHGSVVIAAITSCTNTSNPSVMLAAGLLARNAVEKGLMSKPWVKTSLAPGSKVVTDYFRAANVMDALQKLRFNVVGFGCTTCIGNSGPLPQPIADAVEANKLVVAAVLSGNRNFEGRINPLTRFNYLASPPLVVAYALAGRMDIDFSTEPIGVGKSGPVFLRDIWPAPKEVEDEILRSVKAEMFKAQYSNVFHGDDNWRSLPVPEGDLYAWDPELDVREESSLLRWDDAHAAGHPPDQGRAGARNVRGFDHDRSHLTRGIDSRVESGRQMADRARRQNGRLQFVRRAQGKSRGDDARHLRQHPPPQRARAGNRRRLDDAQARARSRSRFTTRRWSTRRSELRSSSSPARNTAPARRATGQPRARCCSAYAP